MTCAARSYLRPSLNPDAHAHLWAYALIRMPSPAASSDGAVAGAAVLNLLATLAVDTGRARLAYRGPYPGEQLFRTLLESFRYEDGGADPLAAFRRGDLAWIPAPHERLVGPGETTTCTGDGVSRVYTIASPLISRTSRYRALLKLHLVEEVLERERPDIIESGDPYQLAWKAIASGRGLDIPVVGFYHSNFPEAYIRSVAKYFGSVAIAIAEDASRRDCQAQQVSERSPPKPRSPGPLCADQLTRRRRLAGRGRRVYQEGNRGLEWRDQGRGD